MVDSEALLSALNTHIISPRITYLEEVHSTNLMAKDMVRDGGGEGIVVIADRQVGGRGRHGRRWYSPSGGLYLSIVLKPPLGDSSSPFLGIMLANAALRALEESSMIKAHLKWPNDLLVNERKIGGILGELVVSEGGDALAILGIGINTSFNDSDLPEALRISATTIAKESKIVPTQEDLASQIINNIDQQLREVRERQALDFILKEYRKNCTTLGRAVLVELPAGTLNGIAVDIDNNGMLVVENGDGQHLVSAGDVIHLR
ncbi:MAG: biotin--[acetyl-CoA-carboxylase] ligase [Candidatus Thorarchaeota archaeon]|nr:biotin--[acetyl-CoA-carboxylase] ligase [Candidatus Thorarchaeota archaeon]